MDMPSLQLQNYRKSKGLEFLLFWGLFTNWLTVNKIEWRTL